MPDDLTIQRKLDSICDEFEEEWSADATPDFQSALKRIDSQHQYRLLKMLLEVDVELRRKAGQSVDAGDYQHLGDEAKSLVEQLVNGEPPTRSLPNGDQTQDFIADRGDSLEALPPDSKKPDATRVSDFIGHQIGPYRILEELGEGGMGSVYLAEQREPVRRRVALKIIKSGMDTGQFVARFEAERQALAMMDHANIAKVFGAGTTDSGRPYFVMELVDGKPISKFCDKHNLGITERLELFQQVCSAVQHAHQKGIIHRDLKPSNVLVTLQNDKPIPKVIDFGLAKATGQQLTEKTVFTAHGQVLGSFEYMSPEQANLNDLDVDTRADIYSLGVILYELLAGSTPLTRESLRRAAFLEILKRIREEEPERPSIRISHSSDSIESISSVRQIEPRKLSSLMKGELDWIVMKAIEKDRTRRYETANSLALDISRFLNNDAVYARPPTTSYKLRKFVLKHQTAVITAALFVTLLLSTVGISTWFAFEAKIAKKRSDEKTVKIAEEKRRADVAADNAINAKLEAEANAKQAKEQKRQAEKQREIAISAKNFSNLNLYASQVRLAQIESRVGTQRSVMTSLADCSSGFRGWEFYHLCSQTNPGVPLALGDAAKDGLFTKMLSSGEQLGTLITSGFGNGRITIRNFRGELIALHELDFTPSVDQCSFAHKHDWIASHGHSRSTKRDSKSGGVSFRGIKIINIMTGETITSIEGIGAVKCTAFSPDDKQLMVAHDAGKITILDAQTGESLHKIHDDEVSIRCCDWAKNGQYWVTVSKDNILTVWDVNSRKRIKDLDLESDSWFVSCSPDSRSLVVVADEHAILMELPSLEERSKIPSKNASCAVWSKDGERIAIGSGDGYIKAVEVATGKSTMLKTLINVRSVLWSDEHNAIVGSGHNGMRLWPVSDLKNPVKIRSEDPKHDNTDHYVGITISPCNNWVAAWSKQQVRIWNAANGEFAGSLTIASTLSSAIFSHNSELLICLSDSGEASTWDVRSFQRLASYNCPEDVIHSTISSRGFVTIDSTGLCQITSFETGNTTSLESKIDGKQSRVFLSPNGEYLGCKSGNRIRVWNDSLDQVLEVEDEGLHPQLTNTGFLITSGQQTNRYGDLLFSGIKITDLKHSDPTSQKVKIRIDPFRFPNDCTLNRYASRVATVDWSENRIKLLTYPEGVVTFSEVIDELDDKNIKSISYDRPMPTASVCFSSDGSKLACATSNGLVKVWKRNPSVEFPPELAREYSQDVIAKMVRATSNPNDSYEANLILEEVTRHHPHPDYFRSLGIAKFHLGKFDESVIVLKKASDMYRELNGNGEGDALLTSFLAMSNYSAGNTEEGDRNLRRAKNTVEQSDSSMDELAIEAYRIAQLKRFAEMFPTAKFDVSFFRRIQTEKSFDLSPVSLEELGYFVFERRSRGKKEDWYEQMIAGTVYYRLGRFDSSIIECGKASDTTGREELARHFKPFSIAILAMCHAKKGDRRLAEQYRNQLEINKETMLKRGVFLDVESYQEFISELDELFDQPVSR